MVLGVQAECLKTIVCFAVNYNVQGEVTAFGNEEVGDEGEAAGAVEKYIVSWSLHVVAGDSIQVGALSGCKGSWGRGARWDCRPGRRGLLLEEYTWKRNVLQMSLVGSGRVAERKGYWG